MTCFVVCAAATGAPLRAGSCPPGDVAAQAAAGEVAIATPAEVITPAGVDAGAYRAFLAALIDARGDVAGGDAEAGDAEAGDAEAARARLALAATLPEMNAAIPAAWMGGMG